MAAKNIGMYVTPIILILYILTSCISYSTLQTAETLSPGQVRIGAGTVFVADGFAPEAGVRIGMVKNFDMGAKYSIPNLFVVDTKYRFLRNGLNASFDLGVSYYSEDENTMYGYYPMLLFGQKHWYLGVKGNYFSMTGAIDLLGGKASYSGSGYFGTSLITGAMVGGNTMKLLFELNTYFIGLSEPIFVPGLGLYLDF